MSDMGFAADLLSRMRAMEAAVSDIQAAPNPNSGNFYAADLGGTQRNSTVQTRLQWFSIPGDPSVGVVQDGAYDIEIFASLSIDALGSVTLGIQAGVWAPSTSAPGSYTVRLDGSQGHWMPVFARARLALKAGDVIIPRYLHDSVASQTVQVEQGMQIFGRRIS